MGLSAAVRAQVDKTAIIKEKRRRTPVKSYDDSLHESTKRKHETSDKKARKRAKAKDRSKAQSTRQATAKDADSDAEKQQEPKAKAKAKAKARSRRVVEEAPRPKPARSRSTMVQGLTTKTPLPQKSGRSLIPIVTTKTVVVENTPTQSDEEEEEEEKEEEEEEEEKEEKEDKEEYNYKPASESEEEEEEGEEEEEEEEEAEEEEEELSEDDDSKRKASFLKKKRLGKALPTSSPSKKKPVLHAGRTIKRVNQIDGIVPLRRVNSTTTDEEQTPYALARERLHVSAVPESLPCREEEFVSIMGYVESAIQEGTGTCVYISGVPGTGKTATVLEVIRHLQQKADDDELPEFDFVEINGMKLTDPNQAYSILWECVDDSKQKKRYTPNHSLHLLETQFITNTQNQRTTVVLMDELDLLVTKKQSVMYNFFDWPSRPLSKLIVIAVANTMDLPERLMSNKIASRMGLTRINFQPYNYNQLYQIVQSRLEGINAFGKEAVEFAARKVSAVSGDARRALDICRRAVEIVEDRLNNPSTASTKQVTIGIVDEAIKEMFTSPAVAFVKSCSLHQKIFLVSCMQRVRAIGLAEIEFGDVAHNHVQTCKWHNIEPPNTSDLMRVCESLGQSRALVMESGSMDIHMRLSLNLVEEDILMACKTDKFVSMLLQKLMSIE